MPDFSTGTADQSSFTPGLASTTLSQQQSQADFATPSDSGTPILNTLGMAAMAPVDLTDSILSNKYVGGLTSALGLGQLNRGQVNQTVANVTGNPGINAFYAQHQSGIEAMSGVGGMVGVGLLTDGLADSALGENMMSTLSKVPFARRVAQLDTEYQNALSTVRAGDLSLAARGAAGDAQYVGAFTVDGLKFDSKAGAYVPAQISTTRSAAVFKAKALGAAVGVRNTAVTEGVAYAALNSNGFLYSDDASSNLMWQALGVAGGGVGEYLAGAYQIRKYVNSDGLKRTFANAYDPQGVETGRLLWKGQDVAPLSTDQMSLAGQYTDEATSQMSSVASLRNTPVEGPNAAELLSNRSKLATQQEGLAIDSAQKATVKGVPGLPATGFSFNTPGYGNHLAMGMHNDPTLLYGAEAIGGIPEARTAIGMHQDFMDNIEKNINTIETQLDDPNGITSSQADALQANRRRLDFMQNLTPMSLVDGELMPLSEASVFDNWQEPKQVKFTNNSAFGDKNAGGIFNVVGTDGTASGVSLDTDMIPSMPGGKTMANADLFDTMRMYRAGDKLIDHFKGFDGPINVPENPSWFQLDLAENLLRRTSVNGVPTAQVVWPKGLDRSSAMVESLAQKADAMTPMFAQIAKSADPDSMMAQMRMRFNLPKLSSYERGLLGTGEAPTDTLLRGAANLGTDQLRGMPLTDVKQAIGEVMNVKSMTQLNGQDADTIGNSFKFMQDDFGKPVKPLLIYKRPIVPEDWSQDALTNQLAARKGQVMASLTSNTSAPYTSGLTSTLLQDNDTQIAMNTHNLMDNQIQGSVVGTAPQSFFGQIGQSLRTADMTARDTPELLAASRLQDKTQRLARDNFQQVASNAFGGAQNALKNPRNTASALLLDQFHSFRSGWDLNAKPLTSDDGFSRFVLGNTEANRSRWLTQYGTEMPSGQTLIGPNGKEVVLDQLGLDMQTRFNTLSESLRQEKNSLLQARGLQQIDSQNWYTPPPNINGKYIGFAMGPDNKPIPGLTVIATTPQEFESGKNAVLQSLAQQNKGLGYVFRSQQDIAEFSNLFDKAQMDMINPGITALQPGKKASGGLVGQNIVNGAFDASMKYVRDQYLGHATDVLDTVFHDQIQANKARAAMVTPLKANNPKLIGAQGRSIYDLYNDYLLGRSALSSNASTVAKLYNLGEGTIDSVLKAAAPGAAKIGATWDALNAWVDKKNPWTQSTASGRDFDSLSQALGEHNPFTSAADMIKQKGYGAIPITSKQISSKLNQFASAGLLRMFEVAQPIIHLSAIVNAMPSVIRSFAQRDGETLADYSARVGHSGMMFQMDKGAVAIPDMVKMGANAFKRAWSPTSEADYNFMVKRGYLSQEVADFHRQFGSIDSQDKWSRFFNGDHNIQNPTTVSDQLKQKGLVGWLSVLTDKSMDFTRSWGHMAGLELADHLGLTDLEQRNGFAHDIANKMIANYSPQNRPEIYQGAMGGTIGLFQGFIQEYYQRLFRYVETKDYDSLKTQLVSQAGIFGMNSLPGFSQYNDLQAKLNNRGQDADFAIRERLGQNAADLMQHGVLANIPTLFGQDGVSIYTRGDAQVRVPALSVPPAIQFMGKIAGGITSAANAFWNDNGTMTRQQMAEIMAQAMPNRPIAGLIEQMSGGDSVDKGGQLISDTRSSFEMMARVLGMHSERQMDETDSYYANKAAMQHKASADGMLRLATRAAIRGGNSDAVPAIFSKYVDNGGDPRQFSKWMKENQQAATSSRGSRQLQADLKAAYKDPYKAGQIARLLASGVSTSTDAQTPEGNPFAQAAGQTQLDQTTGGLGNYDNQMTMAPQPTQP